MPLDDTIAALATAHGEAAISVIRISGPLCDQLVTDIFKVNQPKPRYATFGRYRDLAGNILDEVVYTYFPEGSSYTGEALLEISTHGSPYIARRVLDDLMQRGCRPAEPGEFTRTAFLNGKMDLSQAEAVIDVIRARSDKALAASQKQLRGSVGQKVDHLINELLQVLAHLEAYIDFPEEDLPPEDQEGPQKGLAELLAEIDSLIITSKYSDLLREGIKTVIVGAPNAGKSSLLNRLTGEERAIVSDIPGTTRDFIEERIIIGPYMLRVVDTAGIHKTADLIEQQGISRALAQLEDADLILIVIDQSTALPHFPESLLQILETSKTLVVLNKSDLPAANSAEDYAFLKQFPHLQISALKDTGITELRETIRQTVESDLFIPGEDKVVVSARHARALEQAKEQIRSALDKMRMEEPTELVAADLRGALDAFGAITGKIDNERMLDKLFASFCIGK